jgi:hypothetical protein
MSSFLVLVITARNRAVPASRCPLSSSALCAGQHHLAQMVGRMVGSTEEDSQSIAGWVFSVVFVGYRAVPLQPFVRGKCCKLRKKSPVHFVPILLQLVCGREPCGPYPDWRRRLYLVPGAVATPGPGSGTSHREPR